MGCPCFGLPFADAATCDLVTGADPCDLHNFVCVMDETSVFNKSYPHAHRGGVGGGERERKREIKHMKHVIVNPNRYLDYAYFPFPPISH